MKGALVRVTQVARLFEALERKALAVFNLDADLPVCLQIFTQVLRIGSERWKQEAIESAEIARNGFRFLNLLDAVDRSGLARIELLGDILSPHLDQVLEGLVAQGG